MNSHHIRAVVPSAVSDAEAAKLQELARGRVVLELGAHYGFSTIVLGQVAKRLVSVDWHKGDSMAGRGDNFGVYRSNLTRFGLEDEVIQVAGRFDLVLPLFGPAAFELAFIDGEHDRASVIADTAAAMRCVVPGGKLAFHDYGRFEVKEVVDELASHWVRPVEVVDHLAVVERP